MNMFKLGLLIPHLAGRALTILDSIANQQTVDFSKIQLVIVQSSTLNDDVQIIENWMNLHQNINTQLIKCPNKLLAGPARNLGVQYLSSEYLWMLDDDDSLYDDQTLNKVIKTLESDPKDIYACGFNSLKNNRITIPENTMNATEFALWAAGVWSKIIKKELYVQQPDYLPEDSWLGCILADNAKTIGTMSFCCYIWDNRQQNRGAITRSWDYLQCKRNNLLDLALSNTLQHNGLDDDFMYGIIRNLADGYKVRNQLKNPDVRKAWTMKFEKTYVNFMSGKFTH